MSTIYQHMRPTHRMINWALQREREINEQISQLQLEKELMGTLIKDYRAKVCSRCVGSGNIMKCIEGCEMDGPRMHTCDKCNGTGEMANP